MLPAPRARYSDPSTSHDAAASMRRAASAQCATVLSALRELGKAGAEQIATAAGMTAYAARKRLPELQDAGLVQPTGELRRTSTGRSERIWAATQIAG